MKTGTTSSHRRVCRRHQRRQQRTLSQREVEILGWVHQYQQGPQLGLFSAMFDQHCSPPPFGMPVKCRTSTPMKEPSSRRPSTPTVETRSSCLKPDEKPAATPPDYGPTLRKRSRSSRTLWKVLLPLLVLIQAHSISAEPHQGEGEFHLVFEEVGLMANSANYLLSKMSINMTVLEESVKDLQSSIKLQIELVKKVAVPKERKDEIEPMTECLMENLRIHLADADAELARVHQLRDTLPTPEEYAKVKGDHLVRKRFVLQLLFGALGTYMGTLTKSKVRTSKRIIDHH
jgi:hypothetical protein